jgi:hypothetical protein
MTYTSLFAVYKAMFGEHNGSVDQIFDHIQELIEVAKLVENKNSQPFYGRMTFLSLLLGAIDNDIELGSVFSPEQLAIRDYARSFREESYVDESRQILQR